MPLMIAQGHWRSSRTTARQSLAQLTFLAAAAVVAAEVCGAGIGRLLTDQAQPHAGHGLSSRLRYRCAALGTVRQSGPLRQLAARALHRVLHGGLDLLVDCAFACPTCCHTKVSAA